MAGGLGYNLPQHDEQRIRQLFQKLVSLRFGPEASPTFEGLNLTSLTVGDITADGLTLNDLTASRLMSSDGDKLVASADLSSWVTGTANRVTVTDDGDGTITLSGPQDLDSSASPSFSCLTLEPTTYPFKFCQYNTNFIGLRNETSGQQFQLGFWTADHDGTDDVFTVYVAKSSTELDEGITNGEWLNIGYISGGPFYYIGSRQNGTGTLWPIRMYCGDYSTQMILETNGTVTFGNTVNMESDLNVDGFLEVGGNVAAGDASLLTNVCGYFYLTDTNPGTNRTGLFGRWDIKPTSSSSYLIRGTVGWVEVGGNSTQTGEVAGVSGSVQLTESSLVSGDASCVLAWPFVDKSGGSVSNLAMFRGKSSYTTGTVTVLYGLYLPDLTFGGTNYAIYTNLGTVRFGDDVQIATDTDKLFVGADQDAAFYYDGTDAILESDLVGASDLVVKCGTEKTMELETAVYKDINLGGAVLPAVPGQQPDRDEFVDSTGTDTGIDTYAMAVGEAVGGSFELQHDYKEGTDLVFHVHWQGIDAPSGTDYVKWQLTYTVAKNEATLDAATTITTETAFDTQYEFIRSDFAAITGTNFDIGDQFLFTLERVASAGDAYAGDALIATVGIHYQVNTLGSRQVGTK